MKVISAAGKIRHACERRILTIGIFDGVHRGHIHLIQKVVKKARLRKGVSLVLTFYPHPYHVLKPRAYLPLLISLKHRTKLIESLGVDVCLLQQFTEHFSSMNASDFIEEIIAKKIKPEEIYVGSDFSFGKNKHGDIALLKHFAKKYSFKVTVVKPISVAGRIVSSTLIRKCIQQGDLQKAELFLSRPVSLLGKVVGGNKRGRRLGFPTANIDCGSEVVPPRGVYLVRIIVSNKTYYGIANIGIRPSFRQKKPHVTTEVYIFNLKRNLYNAYIEIEFMKKIRNEKRFSSSAALAKQIQKDEKVALALLRNSKL
ncbi:riboflavin biosynthesis protein RibF [Candidatus Omnitrophota bacterium]